MKNLLILIFLGYISCTSTSKDKQESNTNSKKEYYPTNTSPLESQKKTVTLFNINWSCECADWIEEGKFDKYEKDGTLSDNSIFIEPANSRLILPDTLGYSGDLIKFVGQFYTKKGYPKEYEKSEQDAKAAWVFRYTSFKIMRSNYKDIVGDKK